MSSNIYIEPPREPSFQGKFPVVDRWMQRVSELLNQLDGLKVFVLNKHTPSFFIKANQVTNVTSLAADTVFETYTITVADATGINDGDYLGIFSPPTKRFYVGVVLSQAGNILTMDRWMDSVIASGSLVGTGITNMSVNGSVTPQIFTVRGADPGINLTIDLTRILFTCVTDAAVNLTQFGDGAALPRGIQIRVTDGTTYNQVNFKTNIEMKGWMLDWESLDDANPGQGLHGFSGRLTWNGKEKLDTAVRIGPGEELQIIIQDDMTSRCTSLEVMTEGSEVPEDQIAY